jgi:hypothetical protein
VGIRRLLFHLPSSSEKLVPHRLDWTCHGGSVAIIPYSLLAHAAPFAPSEPAPLVQAAILVPETHPTSGREKKENDHRMT